MLSSLGPSVNRLVLQLARRSRGEACRQTIEKAVMETALRGAETSRIQLRPHPRLLFLPRSY